MSSPVTRCEQSASSQETEVSVDIWASILESLKHGEATITGITFSTRLNFDSAKSHVYEMESKRLVERKSKGEIGQLVIKVPD